MTYFGFLSFFPLIALAFSVVGFVVVYVAVLYASPRIFVLGLAISGIIAAISMWLQIFHKTPEEADAAARVAALAPGDLTTSA